MTTSLPTGTGLAERKLNASWTKVLSSIRTQTMVTVLTSVAKCTKER